MIDLYATQGFNPRRSSRAPGSSATLCYSLLLTRASLASDRIAKRPICLLGLLDEQCAVGSGTDAATLSNFHATFGGGGKKYAAYEKPRKSADRTFVLSHFAGEVIYSIEGTSVRPTRE